jgi:hypothetical protein
MMFYFIPALVSLAAAAPWPQAQSSLNGACNMMCGISSMPNCGQGLVR